jgi:hypothetical protein
MSQSTVDDDDDVVVALAGAIEDLCIEPFDGRHPSTNDTLAALFSVAISRARVHTGSMDEALRLRLHQYLEEMWNTIKMVNAEDDR